MLGGEEAKKLVAESKKQMTENGLKPRSAGGAFYEICGSGFHG